MRSYLFGAVSVLSLLAATSAYADDHESEGWYLRGNAGYGTHHDPEVTGGIDSTVTGNGIQSEGNGALSFGAGYDFGENWRIEVDGDNLRTDLGSVSLTPASKASLRTDSLMLNALYDFNTDALGSFEPYVGAGLGLVRGKARVIASDFPSVDNALTRNPTCIGTRTPGQASSCAISGSDTGFGWQLLAGLGYKISDNLTWDTHYTYLNGPDLDLDGHISNGANGVFELFDAEMSDVGSHSIVTGVRYAFGERAKPVMTPPPAPTPTYRCWDGNMVFNAGQCLPRPAPVVQAPPPPPPVIETRTCWDGSMVDITSACPTQPMPQVTCPDGSLVSDINFCPTLNTGTSIAELCGEQNRQEIIYYEFNKGQSAETRNAINRILDIGQFCDVSSIRVVGHTDTSGAASYNLALSKRRATDALNELVREGVSRNLITAEGKGETEPFVQTGDGVKEQLNRRTEVLVSLGSTGAFVN